MYALVYNKTKFFPHPFYRDYYSSKEGEIYSKKSNKILKLQKRPKGYLFFTISNKSEIKQYSVHRYVYECFYGIIPKDKQIDHIDNNKINNNINNLQLLSQKENHNKSNNKEVISFNNETKELHIYESVTKASKAIGISLSCIATVCRKERKTAKKKGVVYNFYYNTSVLS